MTSLSAGLLIYDILHSDSGVAAITSKVYPVVAEQGATLPYVCYRRGGMVQDAAKNRPGADTCQIEVVCFASSYAGSIQLAEAVRAAMDNAQASYTASNETLTARSIMLIDSAEDWADDAFAQQLVFAVKIN